MVGAVRGEVGFAGGAAGGPGGDVVELGVGGFAAAAGESAVDVAGADVVGERGGWVVGGAAVVEQGAGEGVGDQAAPDAVGGGLAGEGGGDGADADEFGGVVVGADQGGVGDDDLDQGFAGGDGVDRASRARSGRVAGGVTVPASSRPRRRCGMCRQQACRLPVAGGGVAGRLVVVSRRRGGASGVVPVSGLTTSWPLRRAARMSARRVSMLRGSSAPRPRASRVSQVNAPAAWVAVSSAHSEAMPSASER